MPVEDVLTTFATVVLVRRLLVLYDNKHKRVGIEELHGVSLQSHHKHLGQVGGQPERVELRPLGTGELRLARVIGNVAEQVGANAVRRQNDLDAFEAAGWVARRRALTLLLAEAHGAGQGARGVGCGQRWVIAI